MHLASTLKSPSLHLFMMFMGVFRAEGLFLCLLSAGWESFRRGVNSRCCGVVVLSKTGDTAFFVGASKSESSLYAPEHVKSGLDNPE